MAGAGYRDFTAGAVLTAAQVDTYLQEQSVMVFASAAARDTALSVVKSEGMFAFLLDTNSLTVYTGSAWSTVGPVHGVLSSWTPTVVQSTSVAVTNSYSRYQRVGRKVTGWFDVVCTGTGNAGFAVSVAVPVTAAHAGQPVGTGQLYDASTNLHHYGVLGVSGSATTFEINIASGAGTADTRLGVVGMSAALASGDVLRGGFTYEASVDG